MDISKITDYLYVGRQPEDIGDYGVLHDLGMDLVINMRAQQAPYPDPIDPQIPTKWIETYDSLIKAIPVESLAEGVEEALPFIRDGKKVFVHCAGGRHRSVAMASAILIAMGYCAEEAMETIKLRRHEADPDAWHIRRKVLAFEEYWEQNKPS